MDELPKNVNGKIDRGLSGSTSGRGAAEPRLPIADR